MNAALIQEESIRVDQQKVFAVISEITAISRIPEYNNRSDHASLVWRLLKKNNLTRSELYSLFNALHQIEFRVSNSQTLANWFFSLCKPSAAGGGMELRKWLVSKKIEGAVFQQYLLVEPRDIADFFFGFVFGAIKSLSYDNAKGIYDLLKLSGEAPVLLTKLELERLEELAAEYGREASSAYAAILSNTNRLLTDLTNSLLKNEPIGGYKRLNLAGHYLLELREILCGFLINPFVKVSTAELDKLMAIYAKVSEKVDNEITAYQESKHIGSYAINKYYSMLNEKVTPLLLQFKFFEAGLVFGELIGGMAQIIAGILGLVRGAAKKVAQLSLTSKARLSVMLTLIASFEGSAKTLPIIFADSPAIALALKGEKEIAGFTKALYQEAPYFESINLKVVDLEVAQDLNLASSGKPRIPLLFESSSVGVGPECLVSLLGVLVFMRRRKAKAELPQEKEDAHRKIIINLQKLFKEDALERLLGTAQTNRSLLSVKAFCDELVRVEKLNVPEGATPKQILKIFADKTARDFELKVIKQINKDKNKKIFSRYNIYSLFNSELNSRLRPVAETFKAKGGIILVDQRIASLTDDLLNEGAVIVYKGKKAKLDKILGEFSVMDFNEFFFPSANLKNPYDLALKQVQESQPKLYKLFKKRDDLIKKINTAIKTKKPESSIDLMLNEVEDLSSLTRDRLDELIVSKKITNEVRDGLLLYQYGKTNPYGLCGSLRPDIQIITMFGETSNFDFVHVTEGAVSSRAHRIGGDMYTNVHLVLFGEAPTETAEIPYTFSEKFLNMLEK